jgi:hypothetical protein
LTVFTGWGRGYPSRSFPHARSNSGRTVEMRKQLYFEITYEEDDNLHRKLPALPGTGRKLSSRTLVNTS